MTRFENGLVMGSAGYSYYAGSDKTLKSCFKSKLSPLSDTLQAGACVFLLFQKSLGHVVKIDQGGVHILGEICPRSDPDIAHMGYYLDPIKLLYRTLLLYGHQGARF